MKKFVLTASYAPSIEQEQRPRKKVKPSASIDHVAFLNDAGVTACQAGNYEEAERFFSQALCRADVRFFCTSIQSSIEKSLVKQGTRPSWKTGDCSNTTERLHPASSATKGGETCRSKSQTPTTNFPFEYQRQEYDEGMETFVIPLALKKTSISDSVSSTLCYNIALAHMLRGQYENALAWFDRALSYIQTCESNPTELLIQTLYNIGYCCFREGNNDKSIQHFQEALALSIQMGMDKNYIAASLNSLGVLHFHRHADEAERAMEMLKQSLSIYRNLFGVRGLTKEVATVLNNIGRIYYLWSEYPQALQIYGEALRIRTSILGNDSIDVAATVYNTGQTYHQLGQLNEAMKFYERFLGLAKPRLGTESRDVAIVYRCIAEIHHEQGDLKKALCVFRDALKSGRASLGNYHPEVASSLNNLGNLCYEMHDHATALAYYKEGLEVEQRVLAPDHPHSIITLTNIAHIYKHQSDYARALKAYRQVHKMQAKTYGATSIDVAVTLSSVGLMQYHMKSFDTAFESYQEALRVRRDHYGSDDHADVASTLNSIGLVLFKQQEFDLAKHCFSESLRIRKKLLGPNHRDVAILYYNIATIYFETGQDDVAIRLYKETLRVEQAALGADHPDVALTLQHLGQVFRQLGNLDGALEYFKEALAKERQRRGRDKTSVAKLLSLIGNILMQQGKVSAMMPYFIEASRIYEERDQPGVTLVVAGYNFYGLSKIHPVCAAVA